MVSQFVSAPPCGWRIYVPGCSGRDRASASRLDSRILTLRSMVSFARHARTCWATGSWNESSRFRRHQDLVSSRQSAGPVARSRLAASNPSPATNADFWNPAIWPGFCLSGRICCVRGAADCRAGDTDSWTDRRTNADRSTGSNPRLERRSADRRAAGRPRLPRRHRSRRRRCSRH